METSRILLVLPTNILLVSRWHVKSLVDVVSVTNCQFIANKTLVHDSTNNHVKTSFKCRICQEKDYNIVFFSLPIFQIFIYSVSLWAFFSICKLTQGQNPGADKRGPHLASLFYFPDSKRLSYHNKNDIRISIQSIKFIDLSLWVALSSLQSDLIWGKCSKSKWF